MSVKKEKKDASKSSLILGIIGIIASIVSAVMSIGNDGITSYQGFFSENFLVIFFSITVFIPLIVRNISAISNNSKQN